jgi:hypothetical protein
MPDSISTRRAIEAERLKAAPVLGRDGAGAVLWYNLTQLLCVDLPSKGFLWVLVATTVGLYVVDAKQQLPEVVYIGYGAHVVIAFLYWAARQQFTEVIDAICDWIRAGKGGAGK